MSTVTIYWIIRLVYGDDVRAETAKRAARSIYAAYPLFKMAGEVDERIANYLFAAFGGSATNACTAADRIVACMEWAGA